MHYADDDQSICDALEDLVSRVIMRSKARALPPSIRLTAAQTALTVDVDGFVDVSLSLNRVNYTGDVTPTVTGLPANVTATFTPSTLTPVQGFTTMRIAASALASTATDDPFTVEMDGVDVDPSSVAFTLTVNDPTPASIAIATNNAAPSLTENSATSITITATRTNFTGTITLATSTLPTGLTASFSPATLTGSTLITVLTITDGGTASLGTTAFDIIASGSGVTDSEIAATVTVTAASGAAPEPAGTILTDWRPGGPHDISGAATWAQLNTIISASSRGGTISLTMGGCPYGGAQGTALGPRSPQTGAGLYGWNRTGDFDGEVGLRLDSIGWADRPANNYTPAAFDGGGTYQHKIPFVGGNPPTEFFVQWVHRMGRTTAGGGYDDAILAGGVDRSSVVGQFDITNEDYVPSNAARKWLLVSRLPSVGTGRLDLIMAGQWTTVVGQNRTCQFEISSPTQPSPSPSYTIPTATFDPKSLINRTFTFSAYFKAASTPTAPDGVFRLWIDDVMIGQKTNLAWTDAPFDRIEIPSIIRSGKYTQTDYIKRLVISSAYT